MYNAFVWEAQRANVDEAVEPLDSDIFETAFLFILIKGTTRRAFDRRRQRGRRLQITANDQPNYGRVTTNQTASARLIEIPLQYFARSGR